MQEQLPRERLWVDLDIGAILTIKGLVWGGSFGYFSRREKSDSRTYSISTTK